MRRFALLLPLIVFFMATMHQAIAAATLRNLEIFPADTSQVFVLVETTPQQIQPQISLYNGDPSVYLSELSIPASLLTHNNQLASSVFLRPLAFPAVVAQTAQGSWISFDTAPTLKIQPYTEKSAFAQAIAARLPLYTRKPVIKVQEAAPASSQLREAINAFRAGQTYRATQLVENLYMQMNPPPKFLYPLLGALYLFQENWPKALILYSEGAQQYPETLGLRYSALLYQSNQLNKSEQVLRDMLTGHPLEDEAASQAHYMLGTMLLQEKQYPEALPHLVSASEGFNRSAEVYYNLAIAYEGTHQVALAAASYKQALKYADPDFAREIRTQIERLQLQQISSNPSP